jgi:EmrB/QacA subfamily drug resistance transporter
LPTIEHPFFGRHLSEESITGHDRRQAGLAVICAAMFISAVDSTIVNVALPDISLSLGAGVVELQWVIDGFLVALAGMLLVASGLADRFGRRRVFLSGLAGFAATSVLAALAQSTAQLIAARVLMGAAAACMLPPALSLVAVMFGPAERPRALTVWVAVAGLGVAAGPVLGGILVSTLGWRSVFLVNVPVAVGAFVVGRATLPESRRPGAPALDLVGAGLSIIALASIVFAMIEGGAAGWTSPAVLATAVVGGVAGVAFVRVELRRTEPLFDVAALARPRVMAGVAAILPIYIAFLGILFLLPQYLRYVQGRLTLLCGVILAPIGLGSLVATRSGPRVLARLGPRRTIVGGLVAIAASAVLLLLIRRDSPLVVVPVSLALFGAFVPVTIAPATNVIMDDLGEAQAGDGGAINQLARQVGGALGVAIIGSVFAGVYASRISDTLTGFTPADGKRAGQSIEQALRVIASAPPIGHAHLLVQIQHSFDVAARVSFGVAVALLLAGAGLAALFLGDRFASAEDQTGGLSEMMPTD